MMSKIVALFFAILCSILSASSATTATHLQQPQGTTQLRRIGRNKIYNAQGSIVNEERHRKLQDEEEEDKDVADLLEEVAELLEEDEESGTPTYSPTKPETEEPTSGMPTYRKVRVFVLSCEFKFSNKVSAIWLLHLASVCI